MNRLLMIDDDREVGRFFVRGAETIGFEAKQTDDAREFMTLVGTWRPTVLVIDLLMPGVDGVQLMRELASARSDAQIVIASGVDLRTVETVRRLGEGHGLKIAGVLTKPIRLGELRTVLQPLLRETEPVTVEMLRWAIGNGQLRVEYQPKLRLSTLEMVGVEALARWRLPSGRIIAPDVFVALAEREGLIDGLTEFVVMAAVKQGAEWHKHGVALPVGVAINVSALNLHQRDLPEKLIRICEDAGMPASAVTLEVTETATMQDPIQMMEVLTRLRIQGFGLSLDDFGTGYSSMLQLVRLPFTEIKIDRTFVGEMGRVRDSASVAKLTIDLARSLGLQVTAEGIETQEVLELLRGYGCDFGQGYLFAAAAPAEAVPKLAWAVSKSAGEKRDNQAAQQPADDVPQWQKA